MEKILKIGGYLVAIFGLIVLIVGRTDHDKFGALVFVLIGAAIVVFFTFSRDFSKKRARKELMELKSLLDSGVLNEDEYEEKSKALKNKI